MSEYEILDEASGQALKERARPGGGARKYPEEVYQALLEGRVLHFDGNDRRFNPVEWKKKGRLLRSSVDGNGGRFIWTEPWPKP